DPQLDAGRFHLFHDAILDDAEGATFESGNQNGALDAGGGRGRHLPQLQPPYARIRHVKAHLVGWAFIVLVLRAGAGHGSSWYTCQGGRHYTSSSCWAAQAST